MNADILAKLQEKWNGATGKVFSSTFPDAPLPTADAQEADSQVICPHSSRECLILLGSGRKFFICLACKLGWYGEKL